MNGYLYGNNNYYERDTLAIACTYSISVFENNPLTAEFTSSNPAIGYISAIHVM